MQAESVDSEEVQYFPKSIPCHDLGERYLLVLSAPPVEFREGHQIVEALRIRLRYAYVVSVVLDFPLGSMGRRLLDASHFHTLVSADVVDLTCKKFAIFRRPI